MGKTCDCTHYITHALTRTRVYTPILHIVIRDEPTEWKTFFRRRINILYIIIHYVCIGTAADPYERRVV